MARREYNSSSNIQDDSFYIYNPNSSAITIYFKIYTPSTSISSETSCQTPQWDIDLRIRDASSVFSSWFKMPLPESVNLTNGASDRFLVYSISLPAQNRLYITSNEGSFYRTGIKTTPNASTINVSLNICASSRAVAYGNAMYLLDKTGESTALIGTYNLYRLFSGLNCNIDISVPSFTLPATTLSDHCYAEMFSENTTVSFVPTLPAINAATYCYSNMFYHCTGLVNNSEITGEICLAHTATRCCESMFEGCTNLRYPRGFLYSTIAANREIADYAFYRMFFGCTSLICTPYLNRITNHSSTTTTTRVVGGYAFGSMFYGCTSLTDVSDNFLQYIDIINGTYTFESMFRDCTSLNLKTDGTLSFKGGATSGTISIANYDNPVVFANTAIYCCYRMFYNCTSLGAMYTSGGSNIKGNPIKMLPARVLPGYCYSQMFYGCTNLDISPDILAVDISSSGTNQFYRMFYNCPSLSRSWCTYFNGSSYSLTDADAIYINQTDMGKSNAYYQMFYRTSSSSRISTIYDYHTHPNAWNSSYTNNWLYNATATSSTRTYNKVWQNNSSGGPDWVKTTTGTYAIPTGFTVNNNYVVSNYHIPKWFEIGDCVMAINLDENTTTSKTDKISGNVAVGPSWYNNAYHSTSQALSYHGYNDYTCPSDTKIDNSTLGYKAWMGASKISGVDLSSIITSSNASTGPEYTLMFTITGQDVANWYHTFVTEKEYGKTAYTSALECLGPKQADWPSFNASGTYTVICYNNNTNFYMYVLPMDSSYYNETFVTEGKYTITIPEDYLTANNETCYRKKSTKHTFSNTWGTGSKYYFIFLRRRFPWWSVIL